MISFMQFKIELEEIKFTLVVPLVQAVSTAGTSWEVPGAHFGPKKHGTRVPLAVPGCRSSSLSCVT
jgi:hypothetical protein